MRAGASIRPRAPAAGTPAPKRRTAMTFIGPLAWVAALFPFALLVYDALTGGLAAEPVKDMTHRTGYWALTLLVVTLMITPLRRLTGWNQVIRVRRTLGLCAFFYASVHVLIYFGLDQAFSLAYIGEDILERPYITVGFIAWILLIPLAVTSTRGWIRRLGKRWQTLHRLIYLSAILGVVHFYWQVKADTREPLMYAGALALLLGYRAIATMRASRATRPLRTLDDAAGAG